MKLLTKLFSNFRKNQPPPPQIEPHFALLAKAKYRVYLGFDPREKLAYDVARHSILSRTDIDEVQVLPLELKRLPMLKRPIVRKDGKLWCPISQAPMSTEFAISRFCVPFLEKRGWVLFADCDIVLQADIRELFTLADKRYAVMVVKHQQESGPANKMDGQAQVYYSRKNWSSVMLFNLDHHSARQLTLEHLNTWTGRDLHAFKWLADSEIGELPLEWNTLVDVSHLNGELPKLLHFTLGGKWLPGWKGGSMDGLWLAERKKLR